MKIALHACCGPCLIEPLDALAPGAGSITVVYANSNIQPIDEYERRRDTLGEYAEELSIEVVELPYEPARWIEAVAPHVAEGRERCRACYRLRLEEVASWAEEHGFDAVATTLTVSPYQDAEALAEEAQRAAAAHGLAYVGRDFRDRYEQATKRSRERGMYRQNYCGCVLSEIEARREREERRAARRAARRAEESEFTGGGDSHTR